MKKGMYPIARKLATQSNPLIVGKCFYSHLLLQNLSPYWCWEFGLRNKQQNWDDVGEKRSHMLMDRTWSFFGRLFLLGLKKLKCVITQKVHKSECNSRSYKIVTVHCANAYIMSNGCLTFQSLDLACLKGKEKVVREPTMIYIRKTARNQLSGFAATETLKMAKGIENNQLRNSVILKQYHSWPFYRRVPAILFHKRNGRHFHWKGCDSWLICGFVQHK